MEQAQAQPIQPNHSTGQRPSSSTYDDARNSIKAKWDTLQETKPILTNTPAVVEKENVTTVTETNTKNITEAKALTESDSIFDLANEDDGKSVNQNEWAWGEGIKGEGKKPEWIRKEFKSAEDQAKAYNALIKKFGDFHGAPEAYDFKNIENSEFHVHPEADNAKQFASMAKEMGLSQEGFEKILGFFNKTVAPTFKNSGQKPIDTRAEIAKLGDGGKEKVQILDTWLRNNYPENYQAFRSMMKTADHINAFWRLREMTTTSEERHTSVMHRSNPQAQQQQHDSLKQQLAVALKNGDQAAKEAIFAKYQDLFSN